MASRPSSSNNNNNNGGAFSIEECLFGPSKRAPADIWEATLSHHQQQQRQMELGEDGGPLDDSVADVSLRTEQRRLLVNYTQNPASAMQQTDVEEPLHTTKDIGSLSSRNQKDRSKQERRERLQSEEQVQVQVAEEEEEEETMDTLSGVDDLGDRWSEAASTRRITTPSPPLAPPADPLDHVVPLATLRRIASQGIVDEQDQHTKSFRPVCWRVLLGYLPVEVKDWKSTLLERRKTYRHLVADLFQCPPPLGDGTDLRGHHGKRQQRAMVRKAKRYMYQGSGRNLTDEELELEEQQREEEEEDSIKFAASDDGMDDLLVVDDDNDAADKKESAPPTEPSKEESVVDDADETTKTTEDGEIPMIEASPSGETLESVPSHIKEEWKKSGRDESELEKMRSSRILGMNTLLVDEDLIDPETIEMLDESNASVSSNRSASRKWDQFLDNATLLDEIRKDVVRTHPDLYFFLDPEENLGQRRYAALERILFVWAKLNKGVRYVQGMNEIVGTVYYVLANDMNEEWACEAEADTYFLFNTLMTEMRDIFVPALDNADTGLQGRIENMSTLLSLHDPEVRCHLDDMGIDASFYAIRWLTTLLSREFLLPHTIRLWDSMFASTHKDNFLRYVCVTMVMLIRGDLLKGDFTTCLRLLQAYPSTDMDHLLEASRSLWIYESQITLACHKGGISLHQALLTITPPPSIVMAYGLKGGMAAAAAAALRKNSSGDTLNGSNTSTGSRGRRRNRNNNNNNRNNNRSKSSNRGGFFSGARSLFDTLHREATQRTQSR
mmetsp:Transcript_45365/g.67360  ORF Transcript_45365/g.67360 Transcript_45365/m.67360 type:complete len:782 (-) Transcript_45365:45-2390(-)|eukprot:CAMPEP_0194049564 /NCGR_PEP_ID=MMETSP0009_2-20130614/30754_1 /TAXON_ID=210454 /ORGANISM="Grammatophora oceanica, Strain CCMP 410" /LENGTH=781 /DNA_ID=CAMNT_0038695753 /DNA_START=578 /DNA_END=2923 /DNA_ORIENTATION=-